MAGLGFPLGLSKELIESTVAFPVRFWVVDNSGSMNMNDGTRLVPNSAGRLTPVKTSRWTELSDTIVGIAELASTLGSRRWASSSARRWRRWQPSSGRS